jgi:signal transduction histidine kinase
MAVASRNAGPNNERMTSLHDLPPKSAHSDAYAEETARVLAARLPFAGLVFGLSLAIVWIVENHVHPGRNYAYAVTYGLELVVWMVASLWARRRKTPQCACTIAIGAAVAQVILIASYHIGVHGEADVLAFALAYFTVGMMVLMPWGARAQLIVTLVAMATFLLALATTVHPVNPAPLHAVGLFCIGSLSVVSAMALERYRAAMFFQADALRGANAELQRANEALAAADHAKTQLLANVSHEMRNPIGVTLGYVELIRDGAFGEIPPALAETIDRLHDNAEMLLTLANDLLDLSRLQANRIDLQLEPVKLGPLCTEAARFAPPLLANKAVTLVCAVADDAEVYADPARLRQVLVNLLTNAAKFTDAGQISVRTRTLDDDTQIVEISDTGIGIPLSELHSIFEPFRRGSQAGHIGGAGIGLALSRQLTEAMGGTLTVVSAPGKGSTFAVQLRRTATAKALLHASPNALAYCSGPDTVH